MEELPDHLRDDLAELLKPDQLSEAIEEMASDDAADVLADLPEPLARDLIEALPEEDRHEVETLLKYPEDTAGGLMQVELVSVPETATVDETIEEVRANADEVSTFHFVYVVDDENRLYVFRDANPTGVNAFSSVITEADLTDISATGVYVNMGTDKGYFIEGGTFLLTEADGSTSEVTLPSDAFGSGTGETWWTHSLKNIGETDFHSILVEFKNVPRER